MKIKKYQFGKIEYTKDHLIKFSSGLFGFELLRNHLLIKIKEEIFYWLTSVYKTKGSSTLPVNNIREI